MRSVAWATMLLGLLVVIPGFIEAQEVPRHGPRVELGQNYPNPMNPETTIPFRLRYEDYFADGSRPLVSLRIYNVLAQLVAVPVLQGTGEPLDNIRLDWNGTGEFSAYWDGRILGTDREAPSGVYVYQLVVNGQRESRKMTVVK